MRLRRPMSTTKTSLGMCRASLNSVANLSYKICDVIDRDVTVNDDDDDVTARRPLLLRRRSPNRAICIATTMMMMMRIAITTGRRTMRINGDNRHRRRISHRASLRIRTRRRTYSRHCRPLLSHHHRRRHCHRRQRVSHNSNSSGSSNNSNE
jgi:hypothetical protein